MAKSKEQEIPEGYKQTDFGIIPLDWNIKSLGELLAQPPKYGINAPAVKYSDDLPTYIRITDISEDGRFLPDNKASVNHFLAEKYYLEDGDLVFARTGASVGKTYLYDRRDGRLVFAGFLIRIKPDSKKLNSKYLGSFTKTKRYWNWVQVMSMRSGQPGINGNEYRQLPIPLPPTIREQTAVSSLLSDVDVLVEKTEKLIEKKKNIKQGAMQELLTGRRRLPGYVGKWVSINMSESSILKARIGWQGLTTAEYLDSGDYYLVTGTDFLNGRINWKSCCFVDRARYAQDKNIQLRQDDLLITKDGTIGKVGFIDVLPGPATLNSGVFVIRPKNEAYKSSFLYYVLMSTIFDNFLAKLQAGSTISHLYQKDFVNFTFMAPTIEEQSAIANVLSDMDAEIEKLESQLEKYRNIKQGMMQNLLTGKIRLIKK